MAVKMIPIYGCDKCSFTTEDPDKVLSFKDTVFNGDKSKKIIDCSYDNVMLCYVCIQEKFNMKQYQLCIGKEIEVVLPIGKEIKIVQPGEEDIILEPNQNNEPTIQPQTSGKYLILCKIENEAQEEAYAQLHNLTLKDLRTNYGNSLSGLFVKTGEYYLDEIPKGLSVYLIDCNIINKLIFGVPNIIRRRIQTSNNYTVGYIDVKDFDFQFEEIKYDKKEDHNHLKITGKEEIKQPEVIELNLEEDQQEDQQEEIILTPDIFEDNSNEENEDNLNSILNASIKKSSSGFKQFNDDSDI